MAMRRTHLLGQALWHVFLFVLSCSPILKSAAAPFSRGVTAEPSSTLLEMHRFYLTHPPHDQSLYDLLQVSPNATNAEISKSFRKLSRKYHPDKQRDSIEKERSSQVLQDIRAAYDVLKEDHTRLPYHRYGLMDASQAIKLLTGQGISHWNDGNSDMADLLQLVGLLLPPNQPPPAPRLDEMDKTKTKNSDLGRSRRQRQIDERIHVLAVDLTERLRPYVEGTISLQDAIQLWVEDCDRLKRLPLGAQILRCVGRAYRSMGQQAIHDSEKQKLKVWQLEIQERWRMAKHVAHAAVLGGRVFLTEQQLSQKENSQIPNSPSRQALTYDQDRQDEEESGRPLVDDLFGMEGPSDEEMRQLAREKANQAKFQSLQLEALWKVSKIELDQTVRKACQVVLQTKSFFPATTSRHHEALPRRPGTPPPPPPRNYDGYVGISSSSRKTKASPVVPKEEIRYRVAQALAVFGDVMVQRSKEDTAWMQ